MPKCAGCEVLGLTLLTLGSALLSCAQSIPAQGTAGPARLDGPWVLYGGDPPGGPAASADPRQGATIFLDKSDSSAPAAQVIWLRAAITPDESLPHPALAVNPNANDCEVFVNGHNAADCARWPRTTVDARRWLVVHLPPGQAQISIRIAGPNGGTAILPGSGDVLYGSARTLESIRTATDAAQFYRHLPESLLCLSELMGGAILLLVFRFDLRRREYLWFAAFLFLDGTMSLESVFNRVYPLLPNSASVLTDALGMFGRYAVLVGFIAAFIGVRLNRQMRAYQILLLVLAVLMGLPSLFGAPFRMVHAVDQSFHLVLLFVQLPFIAGSLYFLWRKWRRGNQEAGLLLPSFLLASGFELLGLADPWFHSFSAGRFGFDYDDLSMFFFLVSIGPVLLFRHRRINLEYARASGELEAAREIQQRLVPQSIPALAHWRMEAAYLPAAEVGGDFYQVLAQPGGSVAIAVGDVSGKGLKAAMTGALMIGALRTLAAENHGPAAILARLNSVLLHTGNDGFVTCLCAVLDGDGGTLRIANAGHLPPLLNGREIDMPGALPLGFDPGAAYEERTLALDPGDRLTLFSDGIVEAQSATGELFGFERAGQISSEPAQSIAEQARQFGQVDDITVLTLERVAVACPAPA